MALCYSCLTARILSSCGRSSALLVSVSIASINGDCCVSNDCCSIGRLDLDLVGYCGKGNSGNINKGIINMIKGNDNNMYNLYHIQGIMQQNDNFRPFLALSYEPVDPVIYQSNDHIIVRGFMVPPSVNTMHLKCWQTFQHKEIYAKKCPP